jgi:hypothetical protein
MFSVFMIYLSRKFDHQTVRFRHWPKLMKIKYVLTFYTLQKITMTKVAYSANTMFQGLSLVAH